MESSTTTSADIQNGSLSVFHLTFSFYHRLRKKCFFSNVNKKRDKHISSSNIFYFDRQWKVIAFLVLQKMILNQQLDVFFLMTNVQVSKSLNSFAFLMLVFHFLARSPSTDNESDSMPAKTSRLKPRSTTTIIQSTPRQQPTTTYELENSYFSKFFF